VDNFDTLDFEANAPAFFFLPVFFFFERFAAMGVLLSCEWLLRIPRNKFLEF
jgi:hypothetical protein